MITLTNDMLKLQSAIEGSPILQGILAQLTCDKPLMRTILIKRRTASRRGSPKILCKPFLTRKAEDNVLLERIHSKQTLERLKESQRLLKHFPSPYCSNSKNPWSESWQEQTRQLCCKTDQDRLGQSLQRCQRSIFTIQVSIFLGIYFLIHTT